LSVANQLQGHPQGIVSFGVARIRLQRQAELRDGLTQVALGLSHTPQAQVRFGLIGIDGQSRFILLDRCIPLPVSRKTLSAVHVGTRLPPLRGYLQSMEASEFRLGSGRVTLLCQGAAEIEMDLGVFRVQTNGREEFSNGGVNIPDLLLCQSQVVAGTRCAVTLRALRNRQRRAALYAVLLLLSFVVRALAHDSPPLEITVLSSRADLVSGGDALVQVTRLRESHAKDLTIWTNARDITGAFHESPITHSLIGLVTALSPGRNRLEVKSGTKVLARLYIINHEVTDPLFSGSFQSPFVCQAESAGLGPALDSNCTVRTQVAYVYKSTQPFAAAERDATPKPGAPPPGFRPYDPAGPRPLTWLR